MIAPDACALYGDRFMLIAGHTPSVELSVLRARENNQQHISRRSSSSGRTERFLCAHYQCCAFRNVIRFEFGRHCSAGFQTFGRMA